MRRAFGFALLILLASVTRAAVAQMPQCTAGTAPNMNLGTYTGALSTTGVASITINCYNHTLYTIALDQGTGAGATTTTRKMRLNGVGVTLNYQLFQDSARTRNWGNTTDVLTGTGTGVTQYPNRYPSIPAGQYAPAGTYIDTVSATISDNGSYSQGFTVTAVVQATCSIVTSPLAFGAYSGSLINSTSTISVTCTNAIPYNVGLNAGSASGATVTTRSMTGPLLALLGYQLFINTGRTTNWGNTVGTNTVAGVGSGALQGLTVYGRIPAGESASPGSYTDTIVATITY